MAVLKSQSASTAVGMVVNADDDYSFVVEEILKNFERLLCCRTIDTRGVPRLPAAMDYFNPSSITNLDVRAQYENAMIEVMELHHITEKSIAVNMLTIHR